MAAGQGRPPRSTAYLEAENAWTAGAHRPPRRTCARRSSTRSRRAPRRPTCRCRPATAATGTTAAPSRARSTARAAASRSRDPDDWTPPQPAEDCAPDEPALPGEEVLLDLDALAEGHDFFSLGGVVGQPRRHPAGLLAPTWSATSATRSGSRTCAPASCCPTRSPACSAAPPGTATGTRPLLHDRRRLLARRQGLAAPARHRPGRRRAGPPRDRRALLGRRRPQPHRPVPGDRVAAPRTPREYRFLDADDPDGRLPGRSPRAREGLEYGLEHAVIGGEDVFLVLHNDTGAGLRARHRARSPPTAPEQWRPLIPHDPAVRLEDVDAFAGHLVVHQRSERPDPAADPRARRRTGVARRLPGRVRRRRSTPSASGGNPSSTSRPSGSATPRWPCPSSVYDYDVRTRELTLLKQHAGARRLRPGRLRGAPAVGDRRGRRRRCRSRSSCRARRPRRRRDADPVPALRLRRLRDLDRPVLLGGPALAARPRRRRSRSRTCAAAARWAGAGTTTASCSTSRTPSPTSSPAPGTSSTTGWTTPDRLVAEGGSAGGLLIGRGRQPGARAVRRHRGRRAVRRRADHDARRRRLPLTVTEYDEWGNPEADPEVYDYMRRLRAVRQRRRRSDYPPILAETSLHDTRVLYVEPAKWVARLRATRRPAGATCCSAPRCRPATAASPGATRPGTTGPSRWPGSWTGWASPARPSQRPAGARPSVAHALRSP